MASTVQSGSGNSDSLRVFLCHSWSDKELVRAVYQRLQADGVQPWLDEKHLLGGQNFRQEIENALRTSDAIIIFLSKKSIEKPGFVQREIKYAVDLAQEQPEGSIFLIPLRLEDCTVPAALRQLLWIDYFKPDGYERLKQALDSRAQALGKMQTKPSRRSGFLPGSFGSEEKISGQSGARFLFGSLALCTLALAFAFLITRAFEARDTSQLEEIPQYSPAEQTVVDLGPQIDQTRASYVLLLDQPNKARDVNRDARHLAHRLAAVDDAALGGAMQVYKYEALAYSWAMVAGSEPDSARLKTVEEILRAANKGQQLIDDVMRAGSYDERIQNWREWIVKDNAVPRLQRLSAVALCARWGVKKNNHDLIRVRQIIANLPYDYHVDEHPDTSGELRPCLSGRGDNKGGNHGRAALSGKETKQE